MEDCKLEKKFILIYRKNFMNIKILFMNYGGSGPTQEIPSENNVY